MSQPNLGDKLQSLNLVANASVTTTGLSAAIDLQDYEGEILLLVDVGAVSGTLPTLDWKLRDSDATAGTYADVSGGAGTQVTTSASFQSISLQSNSMNRFVKLAYTIAGDTPVYLISAKIVGMKKYSA